MSSFITWFTELLQTGLISSVGGSTFLLILLSVFGLAMVLWRLQVSMPVALMVSFFFIGVLSNRLDTPFDPLVGPSSSVMFGLILAGTGLLMWHFLFKRSLAG